MLNLKLHDVIVNPKSGKERGFDIPEYFEWTTDDTVITLEETPLIFVTERLFLYLRDTNRPLPQKVLEAIQNKTIMKVSDRESKIVEYAFIATDGQDSIFIDTEGTNIPVCKSKLSYKISHIIMVLYQKWRKHNVIYDYNRMPKKDIKEIQHDYQLFSGLTYQERKTYRQILQSLKVLKQEANLPKLQYLYKELHYEGYEAVMSVENFDTLYKHFQQELTSYKLNSQKINTLVKILGLDTISN